MDERDFTKYHMFLDQHQLSNQPIRFEGQIYSLCNFDTFNTFHYPLILGKSYG